MPRMMLVLGTALAAMALGTPAVAERSFENCSLTDQKSADMAVGGALALAMHAAAAVGNTDTYLAWFGAWDRERQEEVRGNLKAIHRELVADDVRVVCLAERDVDCGDGTYAYILFGRPRVIHLCPTFFAMPSMEEARQGRGDLENGTREGTIIHELSHFPFVAATEDECYSRTECGRMARDSVRAITNADSYQYFAEDVTLLIWATPG